MRLTGCSYPARHEECATFHNLLLKARQLRNSPHLKHTGVTAAVTYVGVATSLLSAPLVARTLGADGRGMVASATAVITTLAVAAFLGLPRGMGLRFAQQDERSNSGLVVIGGLGVIAAVAAVLAAPHLSNDNPQTTALIRIASLVLVFAGYGRLGDEIAMIQGRYVLHNVIRSATLVLPSTVQILLFATGHLTVASAFAAMLAGQVLAIGMGAVTAVMDLRSASTAPTPWAFSIRHWSNTVIEALTGNLDVVLLAAWSHPAEVGVYAVSVTVANATGGLTQALNQTHYARFAAAVRRGERVSLKRASRTGLALSVTVGTVAAIGLWFAAEPVFGPDFAALPAIGALMIVARAIQDQWRLRVFHASATQKNGMVAPASVAGLVVLVSASALLHAEGMLDARMMAATMIAMGAFRVGLYGLLSRRKSAKIRARVGRAQRDPAVENEHPATAAKSQTEPGAR
ncbi:lipopolysaccharide biosynthesis protein [Demequina mangrovi]|uniref:Membrane protein involved in the export of O-antigen and teichoic acid n=1 Tax=Demequina mangrovi TaxID=1043493 RepID=A0A1H6YGP8_9MICO|nr:oligosaccharide flippase family protein [Demequina mangrovi]SEJ40483.1 Membrane protein involved in the export of O-antigen and teichoic acid [Demequina mangrovi]